MKKLYSPPLAIIVLGLCFSLMMTIDFAWAAEDPLTQRQREMNQLLWQHRLNQVERDRQLDRFQHQQKLNQIQQQLNQVKP